MPLRLLLLAPVLAFALAGCSAAEEPRTFVAPTATATATRQAPSATATPAAGNQVARGTPPAGSQGPAPTRPAANCDPSYPAVCIPPPPPDLDCKDIPYKRFAVVGADPHRFDSDGDGIGCES